jgi:hypothetical protein
MRFSSVAILALVLASAAAQRPGGGTSRGGMPPGPPVLSNGNPFRHPNGNFGTGPSWPRWGSYPRRNPPFGTGLFFALPTPIVPDPGFPPDMPYYPQPPPYEGPAFPPADVTQVPTTVSPSLTNPEAYSNDVGSQPAREPGGMSTAGTSGLRMYSSPGPPPSYSDDHPALIALKNGWAYSVLKYWTQGKIVHFITSQGDRMQAPVTQVERIYPSSGRSHVTDPQSPPFK